MSAELRGLTVHIDTGRWAETAFDTVDLVVPAGQLTVLLGESGSGKSMVAAALAGRLPASAEATGDVRINGAVVDGRQWESVRGSTVGYLPQDGIAAFDPELTVGAQLRALERRHQQWTVDRACAAAWYPLDALDLLPRHHSGGQIQRAALAAALLPAPTVLIADDPTASIDTGTKFQIWKTLREYADTGAAVLTITHDVDILTATGVADRIAIMRAGRIIAAGPATEIPTHTDPYIQGFFCPFGQ
ncbi:ATP-binding cassette domain-containing protein [Nocardia sp. NPDC058176]|uniref:ATP-binding cassette domain-containing protein n=1 Tax=Nocardia sp. NPDC058176 TaxID=3346368 RepID=UPI0036DE454A